MHDAKACRRRCRPSTLDWVRTSRIRQDLPDGVKLMISCDADYSHLTACASLLCDRWVMVLRTQSRAALLSTRARSSLGATTLAPVGVRAMRSGVRPA